MDRYTGLTMNKTKGASFSWTTVPRPYSLLASIYPLQDENTQLKGICEEQEQALEELGCKLSE